MPILTVIALVVVAFALASIARLLLPITPEPCRASIAQRFCASIPMAIAPGRTWPWLGRDWGHVVGTGHYYSPAAPASTPPPRAS